MTTLAELLELAQDLNALDDDALHTLMADLTQAGEDLAEAGVTDQTLADLSAAADAAEAIRAELDARDTAADERATAAADAIRRLRGEASDPDPEPEAEPEADADDEPEEPEATTTEVADPPAPEVVAEAEPTPVPIAAAAAPAPVVSRVAARRPTSRAQERPAFTPRPIREWGLVAAANAPGLTAGAPIRDARQLAEAFLGAWEASRGWTGSQVKVPLARIGRTDGRAFPAERFLTFDPIDNQRKLNATLSEDAVTAYWRGPDGQAAQLAARREGRTAAGGICAPLEVRYDIPGSGSTARPFRDQALTRYGVDRGGVRTIPPPVITDFDGGVDVWTEANDVSPSDPATKPCLTMTCPDDDETVVDAITRCLQVGNFRARYFPEQVEEWMSKLAVAAARLAEETLIGTVGAGSTQVSVGTTLGTTRTVLAGLDRLIAGMRYRHRLDRQFPLTFVYPEWLFDNVRSDLARQMPVGTLDETLAVADAEIEAFLASRNLRTVAIKDGESGQGFAAQPDGHALPWPSTVVTYLYPSGSWLFLDGGSLDVGMFRDSTLVAANNYRFFAETFEAAHFHGIESQRVTFDICPDGSASALVDIDPCTTGS